MAFNNLPDVVLVRVLSFLSIEDLEAIRLVCRKVEEFAAVVITKQLKQRSDWRLDYIQMRKYQIDVSPFLVRRMFQKSKLKKTPFTHRTTRIHAGTHGYTRDVLTEVFLSLCRISHQF